MEQKGLMDMDNSGVIAGGRWDKGTKWQWKKIQYRLNFLNRS